MKRAMITGGAGFVGANLARRLVRDGLDVQVLVRPACDRWRIADLARELHVCEVSLEDREAVAREVRGFKPEWVFHLAAHGAYSWQDDVGRMVRTNLLGTIHMVEACLAVGFEALIHTGSSSEYGSKDHAPAEDEMVEPNSVYAVTKASATLYCGQVAKLRRAPIQTLRLYSVFGPFEAPARLIPRLVSCGLEGRLPPLAAPSTARDYVFVDDVV